ncbi:MAG: chorismate synthase [Eubacteriales bacterium]|nr:chorismate synthase [Eubacteriales bacterium]
MSSSYGENIRLTIFGQSHSPAIGVTIEGLPAGEEIDLEALQRFLARRAPGQNAWSTARREADEPEFVSGLTGSVTCGAPLTALIRNGDTRSKDYSLLARLPRPGHADYTAFVKYGEHRDYAGGGHFSGRLTAPLCLAGGICLQLLAREGIHVISRIAQIGPVCDRGELLASTAEKPFPVVDDEQGEAMRAVIAAAKAEGDSVGGIVECAVLGLPAGLGDPMFDGMENRIARIVFGIPAVKGLEFGAGFSLAAMRGSEANDAFAVRDGRVVTETNHCGGILGGITDGMPLVFRAAFKPTPSIAKEQRSVDLLTLEEKALVIEGRHDPCIVPRAVPVVEAAAAIAVYDALLEQRKDAR